jgi:methyl-accepting chemotaxis protein
MFSNLKISTKFIGFTVLVVVISVSVTTFATLYYMKGDLTMQAQTALEARLGLFWDYLRAKGGSETDSFRIEDEKLMIGSYVMNGNYEVVDKIKRIFGGTATIFMRDVRVSTNVLTNGGDRAVGTKLQGPAYDAIFKTGTSYRGEAPVLGKPYFTAYDPIKNAKGDVIGVLYVGIPKAELFRAYDRIAFIVAGIALLLVVVIATAVFYYVKTTTRPLIEGVEIANRLAEGDLTPVIAVAGRDEVGQLLASIKNMIDKWKEVVGELANTADNMASASTQLRAGAEQILKNATIEAERTSQVASASVEMSQAVNDIARNTTSITASAAETTKVAKEGEQVVTKSVEEVQEIALVVESSAGIIHSLGERSTQIGAIIGVINDIADQTNLLALNAAIEAARAGEQGRGFAVVADEVRKLAERTASATTEIGTMIKAIQSEVQHAGESMKEATDKVESGVRLSGEAGSALAKIIHAISGLQEMVQQIASATVEMAETSENITRDVENIAAASREVSASSSQTRQASVALHDMSTTLQMVAGRFRLK